MASRKRKKQSKKSSPRTRSQASVATSADIKVDAPPSAGTRPNRKVYLPIIVEKYGREPKRNEVIHHLNQDPWDNRPENLVLLPKHLHWWLHRWHAYGKIAPYKQEIIAAITAFGSDKDHVATE